MIRAWLRELTPSVRNPPRNSRLLFALRRAFFIEKYNIWRYWLFFQSIRKVLRMPREMELRTSPSTAPATKSDTCSFNKYCTGHEKWHLRFTKYCACHTEYLSCGSSLHMKRQLQCAEQQMSPSNFSLPRKVTLELHQVLRLPRKVTLELHQILRLPRKVTLAPSANTAPATKSNTWASPSTAPATQNDSTCLILVTIWNVHLQCARAPAVSLTNLTKYCPCHAKWLACLILVAYETSFTMRGAPAVTRQTSPNTAPATHNDHPHIWQKHAQNSCNVMYSARPIRAWSEHDRRMIRAWSEN